MSHFEKYQCTIKDLGALKRAVTDLGYGFVEGSAITRNFGGYKAEIQLKKSAKGDNLPFGFAKQSDGTYALVGDSWGTGINTKKLAQDLTQHTLKHQVQDWMLENHMSTEVYMEGEILYVEGKLNEFGA